MKDTVSIIKADRICARFDKDHARFATLTNLLGAFDLAKSNKANLAKTDNDILLPVLKAALSDAKGAAETYRKLDDAKRREASERDVRILEGYMPEQLTEEDLVEMIAEFKAEGKKMPDFMKHLRENYVGAFDGKLASSLATASLK